MQSLSATALLVLALVLAVDRPAPLMAETEYYPGLRKLPAALSSWNTNNAAENAFILEKLTNIIEKQTRRRFKENQRQIQHAQQILRQQQAEEYQQNRLHHLQPYPSNGDLFRQSSMPSSFTLPKQQQQQQHQFHQAFGGKSSPSSAAQESERMPFAIGPDDPRFHETSVDEADIAKIVYTTDDGDDDDDVNDNDSDNVEMYNDDGNTDVSNGSAFLDDYEEMLAAESSAALKSNTPSSPVVRKSDEASSISLVDGVASYKLKAPMEIKPAIPGAAAAIQSSSTPKVREDISSLVRKLQTNGQADAIINTHHVDDGEFLRQHQQRYQLHEGDVVRTHVDMNAVVDMYVVAIIAGISATVTVGLVAIGIGWYTLHKKSMAAADVEYPAYGVTGPNKDISPSGDRRLAQSAQMYHYQHQKQQIIAMENRTHNEHRNGSMTDADSDEENEEGDYTVYECPGLAPTGEMEVKNPLFLDDPTPATPANLTSSSQHGANSTTVNKPANSDDNINVKKANK